MSLSPPFEKTRSCSIRSHQQGDRELCEQRRRQEAWGSASPSGVNRRTREDIAKLRRRIGGQLHACTEPNRAKRRRGRVGNDRCEKPWHAGDGVLGTLAPREREHRGGPFPPRLKRHA